MARNTNTSEKNEKKTGSEILGKTTLIPGLNPAAFVENAVNSKGETYPRLPVAFLGDWFRSVYPEGRYEEELNEALLVNGYAVFTARIYKTNDSEKADVTAVGAARYDVGKPDFDFINAAKWSAYRSALGKLGFHVPLDVSAAPESGEDGTVPNDSPDTPNDGDNIAPTESGNTPTVDAPEPSDDTEPEAAPEAAQVPPAEPVNAAEKPATTPSGRQIDYSSGVPMVQFNHEDDVESILAELTLGQAKEERVPFGKDPSVGGMRGKTYSELGQSNLEWIVSEKYKGKDNLARACARKILETLG